MRFEKVSYDQYASTSNKTDDELLNEYNNIRVPRRATVGSAGYDFFAPWSFTLEPGQTVRIPSGIRVILDNDKVLQC